MKEFIEKLIERLEEHSFSLVINWEKGKYLRKDKAIEIVNELAEEYKGKLDDEWQIIYNKILNLEKKYAKVDGDMENVNRCIRLENLLQYFKEELQAEPLPAPYKEGCE